ncbi:hypothetical protein S40285_10218 [Stachybotrys chlorohalonatus IBT 40285]|uniref:Uncharacterized protein n=1 Tax=Stachybotrys chlorohalonatus (strain IBT 40285) TaxID=1283841 RepID=A0A084QIU2_STAC4|nr:hypothetical protein S40285_10218 [Stachybotrys chlorohalonata IBT 40285]
MVSMKQADEQAARCRTKTFVWTFASVADEWFSRHLTRQLSIVLDTRTRSRFQYYGSIAVVLEDLRCHTTAAEDAGQESMPSPEPRLPTT